MISRLEVKSHAGELLKPLCWKPPGHYLCTPEPGRLGCVIYIEKGVNSDAYPVAISQKVTKIYPSPFIVPRRGLKMIQMKVFFIFHVHVHKIMLTFHPYLYVLCDCVFQLCVLTVPTYGIIFCFFNFCVQSYIFHVRVSLLNSFPDIIL